MPGHSWFTHIFVCLLQHGRHLWYRGLVLKAMPAPFHRASTILQRGTTCHRCGYHVEDDSCLEN